MASGGHSSSRCTGLSLSRPLLLRSTGSRHAGSVVVAHGPSCSVAYGILPDQGSNPYPLHWQADFQPLHHQGSPPYVLNLGCLVFWTGCLSPTPHPTVTALEGEAFGRSLGHESGVLTSGISGLIRRAQKASLLYFLHARVQHEVVSLQPGRWLSPAPVHAMLAP